MGFERRSVVVNGWAARRAPSLILSTQSLAIRRMPGSHIRGLGASNGARLLDQCDPGRLHGDGVTQEVPFHLFRFVDSPAALNLRPR